MIEDDLIVSWESLFGDSTTSGLPWESSINLTQGIDINTGTFEVRVDVISKYIIGSTYGYKHIYLSAHVRHFNVENFQI